MKNLKKFGALLLTLVMMLSLSVTAFAAEGDPIYSITIDNAVNDETYTAYKVFNVTAAKDADGNNTGAYSYYLTSDQTDLKAFLEGAGLSFTASADGTQYLVNAEKENVSDTEVKFYKTNSDGTKVYTTAAQLAAAINSDLKSENPTLTNGVLPTDSTWTATAKDGTATIAVTSAGYYFVDSSLGALCALGTAANTVTIKEKNTAPTITKQVQDDASDDNTTAAAYGDSAVLDVSDIVYYKLTVNTGNKENITPDGTGVDENYVIEDTLPAGFTYNTNSIEIKVGNGTSWGVNDYTVNYTGQKLTITLLSTGALKDQTKNTDITITYTAKMTDSQVAIGAAGNTNTVVLTYKNQKPTDSAIVYTYQIGGTATGDMPIIQKVDGTTNQPLTGVKFILSKDVTTGTGDDATTTTYYAKVSEKTTGTAGSYYLTGWTTTETEAGTIVTGENGGIEVLGLDAGTYVLTETEALPGYNMLTDTITAVIAADGTVTYKETSATGNGSTDGITITNNTGTELPSTGGMGTTIFYIVGGVLVLGAAILLVTKRRMNAAK